MKKKLRSDVEAAQFDEKIERDAKFGKLDLLAEQALIDHRAERSASYEKLEVRFRGQSGKHLLGLSLSDF